MIEGGLGLVALVVVLGLAFEYVNGFHDAANAIATVVATRVLNPLPAVLMAGAMNFLGAVSGTAVATTIGKGLSMHRSSPSGRSLRACSPQSCGTC